MKQKLSSLFLSEWAQEGNAGRRESVRVGAFVGLLRWWHRRCFCHGGHWEKSLGWLLFILEKSGALTRWKRNGRRHIQNVPACPQVLPGHGWKRKSKLYQVMLVPWWQCPEIAPTHYLWNFIKRPVLWEQEGRGKQNLCFCATPRSHLTFYNPFSSLGRGKKGERRWERQERKPKD